MGRQQRWCLAAAGGALAGLRPVAGGTPALGERCVGGPDGPPGGVTLAAVPGGGAPRGAGSASPTAGHGLAFELRMNW